MRHETCKKNTMQGTNSNLVKGALSCGVSLGVVALAVAGDGGHALIQTLGFAACALSGWWLALAAQEEHR